MVVGSRGDVQPFVALGKVLKETYGHRIRLATHPTFKKFVEETRTPAPKDTDSEWADV